MKRLFIVTIFSTLILSLVFPSALYAFKASDIYNKFRHSVVTITAYKKGGKKLGAGTGFFIDNGRKVVTNYHVVKNADYVVVKKRSGGKEKIKEVYSHKKTLDIVILPVRSSGSPLKLTSKKQKEGVEVSVIGNPVSSGRSNTTGNIVGLRKVNGYFYYEISAPIFPGYSGGPVINSRGEIVGVSTFILKGRKIRYFAVPTKHIAKLVRKKNTTPISELK